jgi:hypothetical protein
MNVILYDILYSVYDIDLVNFFQHILPSFFIAAESSGLDTKGFNENRGTEHSLNTKYISHHQQGPIDGH